MLRGCLLQAFAGTMLAGDGGSPGGRLAGVRSRSPGNPLSPGG